MLAAADTDGGYRIAGPFWQHHQAELFQIDVLLLPNITLTSLLEVGLDLSYETGDLSQLAVLMQSKNIPCRLCTPQQESGGKVLVISCITGMGTAEKIEKKGAGRRALAS